MYSAGYAEKMESPEEGEVSVITEVGIAEELPNGDDSAFASGAQHEESHGEEDEDATDQEQAVALAGNAIPADRVFVATSHGLLTAEQLQEAGIKTTHIVIHDETLTVPDPGLKTPTTPLPPPTPSTPNSRERGFRYQWETNAFNDILPVRCKNSNGLLHKARFGSGGRGRCIKMDNKWYTPSEYESACGRASSKDWKRSIRYGGRALQCLIEDGLLQPHATSCTCGACCDDESVTGPVRLFVPYRRRKKDSVSSMAPAPKKRAASVGTSPSSVVSTSPGKDTMVVSLTPHATAKGIPQPLRMTTQDGEILQIIPSDAAGNIVTGSTLGTIGDQPVVMTSITQQPMKQSACLDVHEQKQWWQLEEMANNLAAQVEQLKRMLELTKQQSVASKEAAFQQLRAQMEKEKTDAVNAVRIEAQMNLQRTLMEERAAKDIAVQQALAQVRSGIQDKVDTVTLVPDPDKVNTYSMTWAPSAGQAGQNHLTMSMEEDSDKEKE